VEWQNHNRSPAATPVFWMNSHVERGHAGLTPPYIHYYRQRLWVLADEMAIRGRQAWGLSSFFWGKRPSIAQRTEGGRLPSQLQSKGTMRVLMVYPETPDTFWSFRYVLRFISKRAAFPPLGLLTVAAMLPREWEVRLVDMNVEGLTDAAIDWADYIMISGMIVHRMSVRRILARFQAFQKPVIAGGPLFTTGHSAFPEVQHVVIGEAEEVMAELIEDMRRGSLRREYQGKGWPDITRTPVPRWDLIDARHYATMAVQFSRGCPFDCEFCDIVVMNGHVPRTKTPEQLIQELETLHRSGWKDGVFIVDDNFIGNRKRTRELLRLMVSWRARRGITMTFLTEASVNLADDAELCTLMARCGFKKVFVGIETPDADSLEECRKLQNQGRDLIASVRALQRHGLEVMGGFIVGFDHDKQDVFARQFEFIQRSGVVTAMVGLLTALPQTRLYQRLMSEGRLEADATGNNTEAVLNFRPKLSREFLVSGYRDLMKRLYEPAIYYARIRTFLSHHQPGDVSGRLSINEWKACLRALWLLGLRSRGRRAYWNLFWGTLVRRPRQFPQAMALAIIGHHFRRVAQHL
jgi:radical SAM superfamily enzyme YgiQ (UPF0313 family)